MASRLSWLARRRRKRELDDALARAARLGITPDRVLDEYRRIAFANLSHIVHWNDGGMRFKPDGEIDPDDLAAIAEIVESAKEHQPYRVKLYDKKGALDALARYLGMTEFGGAGMEEEPIQNDAEDPRRTLARKLARLAAEGNPGRIPREPDVS